MSHPNQPSCEEIEPLLAAYALGEQTDELQAAVEAHLAGCARCRDTLAAYRGLARLLPLAVAEAAPAPALRERVVEAVASAGGAASAPTARPRPRWPWLRPLPILAGLAFVALLAWNLALQSALQAERAAATAQAAAIGTLIQAPGRAELPLAGAEIAPAASGAIILDRDGDLAVVSVADMPPLPPGRVYQLWFVAGDQDRDSGGTFTVDAEGCATIVVRTPVPISAYRAVGVTVEPVGGSPGPTSPRVIGGPLS